MEIKILFVFAIVFSVASATGQSKNQSSDKVIVTINGKPLITAISLEKEKADLIESNPQLKSLMAFMDEKQLDHNIVTSLVTQKAIEKYITDNKIDQTPEYKKEMENMLRSVRQMVNGKFFGQKFATPVTDADVKKFYDTHKSTMPELLLSEATEKQEAQYQPFESVKAGLKNYLEKENKSEKFEQEIAKLMKKYNIVVDESYFK